ncbi:ferritin-like domain-containing protein [Amycolatopsis pigmentata]|uniref:Ferritin-like domain-containing protein n=1 Tax=Amycolatopsis pigmentata TaxID=450801 RepID=A0ABW5G5P9_9PSEU
MTPRTRRDVLRAGTLAALAVSLTACRTGYSDEPDPLAPLAEQARADADAAHQVQGAAAAQMATLRSAHAQALQAEVDRLNRPKSATHPDTPSGAGVSGLRARLATARQQAENLVPSLQGFRAGLVAAVAAGCAGLQEVSELGTGEDPGPLGTTRSPVAAESVDSLQKVLTAEHAAVWVYTLVTAFVPSNIVNSAADGATEHRDRRDACIVMLTAAGAQPAPAEPAYLTPQPVTDAASAKNAVAAAEADAMAAWRGVLERAGDGELRALALRGMLLSARRGTRWRISGDISPIAVALPGAQPS